MTPSISVIVPIYNVEKYIGKCARSLFEQTLRDVEYIFVNDGTPDASLEVLRLVVDEYPDRASAVKIVDKPKNEGLPAARKSGLAVASGEYIVHCDSDDWMEPGMLERLYSEARTYDADGVVCGWMRGDQPAFSKYTRSGENCRDYIFEDMIAMREMQSVWRYMFKREIYSKGVAFPRYNQGEDHALVVQLAYYSKSIYCIAQPLYHWRYNEESITHSSSAQTILSRFEGACANARQVESFLRQHGEKDRLGSQIVAMKLCCMFYMRPLLRQGEGIGKWRKEFPEINGQVLFNPYICLSHKVEYLIDKYCPVGLIKLAYKWRSNSRS